MLLRNLLFLHSSISFKGVNNINLTLYIFFKNITIKTKFFALYILSISPIQSLIYNFRIHI